MSTVDEQVRELNTKALGLLLQNGTIQQLRAVGQRLAPRGEDGIPDAVTHIAWQPFDLPEGYVQLWFASGFTCGIGPEGNVSS